MSTNLEGVRSEESHIDRALSAEERFERCLRAFAESPGGVADALRQLGKPGKRKALKAPRRNKTYEIGEGDIAVTPEGVEVVAWTKEGHRIVGSGGEHVNRSDPQWMPAEEEEGVAVDRARDPQAATPDELVSKLVEDGESVSPETIFNIELTRFDAEQRDVLLPRLWDYILAHRDSNDRKQLTAVASAIRKYIAIMPMDRMGELAVLLDPAHKAALPIELEIEVAKMIYRNFEVHPPSTRDPEPQLAGRLWEMVEAYTNPRVFLRDKHATAASLAIEAIIAMRGSLSERAWQVARDCPHAWFAELVSDNLDQLHQRWMAKDAQAAAWLDRLRGNVALDT